MVYRIEYHIRIDISRNMYEFYTATAATGGVIGFGLTTWPNIPGGVLPWTVYEASIARPIRAPMYLNHVND
jgi:hypothetical protein